MSGRRAAALRKEAKAAFADADRMTRDVFDGNLRLFARWYRRRWTSRHLYSMPVGPR